MESQTFIIDQTQLNKIRNRALIRNFKLLAIVLLFVGGTQYFESREQDRQLLLLSTLGIIPILLLPVFIGTNRLKKSYATLQIVLNESGVEAKAEMMPYKNITWDNLIIEVKSNGAINLYDKSISAFTRKMYGRGWIIIQPETIDKEVLANELFKRRKNIM